MSWILATPIILPFATAVLAFLFRHGPEGRWLSVLGSAGLLVASIILMVEVLNEGVVAAQMGGWPAPFGITLVADLLSAVMVVITGVTGLAIAIYSLADIEERKEHLGYHALYQVLLAGVCGAFLTGDLFNLYVWFEVMLISSFGLLVMGGNRQQLDGGIKYVTLNLVSTVMFLSGIGLLYGMTGTLNMADLHSAVQSVENPGLLVTIAVMFMVAFGVKAAVFPLFFWLPASYHTPAISVSAIFAGLLTKVGVYSLMRMFTLVFTTDVAYTHTILLWVAGFTHGHRRLGRGGDERFPPHPVVPHRIPDRLHDPRPRAVHTVGPCRSRLLPRSPHHRESQPLPRGWRRPSHRGLNRPQSNRRPLQIRAFVGAPVPHSSVLACRFPAFVGVLGEVHSGQGSA